MSQGQIVDGSKIAYFNRPHVIASHDVMSIIVLK
jgi:hypothetical protein